MVIDYAIDTLKIKQKKLSIKSIGNTVGANAQGTMPARIEDINVLLADSRPNIKFRVIQPASFNIIINEIEPKRGARKPVIAWINLKNDSDGIPWHAVIINGYSDDLQVIDYIDPAYDETYCQRTSDIGSFVQDRLGRTGLLIVLVISELGETDLYGNVLPSNRRRRPKK